MVVHTRRKNVQPMLHCKTPIRGCLQSLSPIEVQLVENGDGLNLFKYFISAYHSRISGYTRLGGHLERSYATVVNGR
jgi:hypothetical protein